MSNLKLKIDVDSITKQFEGLGKELEQELLKGVRELAAATKQTIEGWAQNDLRSTRKKFTDGLKIEEVAPDVYVISVSEKALFIEEGLPPNFDLKPGLLAGKKYRVIPFEYGKPPKQNTESTQMIVGLMKSRLKKEGIPFKKIEVDEKGSPRVGKLHTLNLKSPIPGKGNTPQLHGLNIYQTKMPDGSIKRSFTTFRTVSSGPKSAGKFIHPGLEPKKYLDKALDWADKRWEDVILPSILEKYK